ncbi:MAG TPA: metallophosphoesterase family protein, partial [Actinopolymorphaceae bacterium]|nr:metallophosphoesterase family protein [Actinopolymorphaceae bacterium]
MADAQPIGADAQPIHDGTRPASRDAVLSDTCERGDYPHGLPSQSWIGPRVLWHSRNHVLAKLVDPTAAYRAKWVSLARERAVATNADPDFVIRRPEGGSGSVIVFGDPGEGDDSQLAVVPTLRAAAGGIDFAVICSDVIYPTGDGTDYEKKFYEPYKDLDFPIYGLPGNHDWYDGLRGFAGNFCDLYAGDFSPFPR